MKLTAANSVTLVRGLKRFFLVAGTFSFFINALMLVPSIYMLQVYDRVLASRNEMTLLMLTLIILVLYGLPDGGARMVAGADPRPGGAAQWTPTSTNGFCPPLFGSIFGRPAQTRVRRWPIPTTVRELLTGNGLLAFFDAPWVPIFIIVIFLLHPMLGWVSLAGGLLLIGLTYLTEWATHKPLESANGVGVAANQFATNSFRNAEVIEAMGMFAALRQRRYALHGKMLALQTVASDRAGTISAITRFVRVSIQSLILGGRPAGDRWPDYRRYHDRGLDPDGACAGPRRNGDRHMEAARFGSHFLCATVAPADGIPRRGEGDEPGRPRRASTGSRTSSPVPRAASRPSCAGSASCFPRGGCWA